jgi:parallel beta-helix repeat protein
MRDRFRCGVLVVLLALSLLNGVGGVVQAQERYYIYIRADGAIECTDPGYTVPIVTTDNTTYMVTGDIGTNYAITVERDHIVIDGGDHSLEGSVYSGTDFRDYVYLHQRGIDLLGRRNVTVRDLHITFFETAIWNQGVNNTIRKVHYTSVLYGIVLGHSSFTTIISNQFLNVTRPISLPGPVGDHHYNISYNTLIGPMIGIDLLGLSSSVIRENRIIASTWGYGAQGMGLSLCTENTIVDNTITNMSFHAIVLSGSSHNTIVGNTITDNDQFGLRFLDLWPENSSYNTVHGNHIARHNAFGIEVGASCEHNRFYHNTIEDNGAWYGGTQVSVAEATPTVWDDGFPSGGNYWSDYTGYDQDDDGIGDTPYVIDAANQDRYPLTTRVRTLTSITCAITPSELPVFSTLTLNGAITPVVGTVPVILTFVKPDGTTVNQTVTSRADSVYTATYTPPIGGAWSVSASWAGDDPYDPATSTSVAFTVTPEGLIPTTMTCFSIKTPYCGGDRVTIKGQLSPAVSGVLVTITFNSSQTGIFTRSNTTGADGSYVYSYWSKIPTASQGNLHYTITASWVGDATHHGATSPDAKFTVQERNAIGFCCFIATATYGSAMAPEVQFLRDFRADTVLATFTGRQFMAVFNAIYYSFSPTVASGIASNEGIRRVARAVLFPLIRILQVGEWVTQRFAVSPDLGIVAFVLVVSALLSLVYLMPWALLLSVWRRAVIPVTIVRRGRDLLMGSVGLLLLAIALQVPVLTMAGGALTVLLTAGLTTITVTRAIRRRLVTT